MKKYKLFLYLAALNFGIVGISTIYAFYNNITIQPSLTIGVCYMVAAAAFIFNSVKEK